ncbi:hypothetical protein HAX54_024367, partial [Datura stramonium]|nr:hypothetical protein [Datura stramonium]
MIRGLIDTVLSSRQLESEKAHDHRRTADRPNHEAFLDMGVKSERPQVVRVSWKSAEGGVAVGFPATVRNRGRSGVGFGGLADVAGNGRRRREEGLRRLLLLG